MRWLVPAAVHLPPDRGVGLFLRQPAETEAHPGSPGHHGADIVLEQLEDPPDEPRLSAQLR